MQHGRSRIDARYGIAGFDVHGIKPPKERRSHRPWVIGGAILGELVGFSLDMYFATGHKLDSGFPEVLLLVGTPVAGGVLGKLSGIGFDRLSQNK